VPELLHGRGLTVNALKQYDEIFSFRSLIEAHYLCRKNKRHKDDVVLFEIDLGSRAATLERELLSGGYKIKNYKQFYVYEPKKRLIECLLYRDRLVQKALINGVLAPALEDTLLRSNCACRKGKGTEFAVKYLHDIMNRRYTEYGTECYILKCDIRKYFESIDHDILRKLLGNFAFEGKVTRLLCEIIGSYHCGTKTGVPLGNETSQWFALLYLHPVDKFVTDLIGDNYVRYMDDFIAVVPSKRDAVELLDKIKGILAKLKLELNNKTQIIPVTRGVDFLGFHHRITKCGKGQFPIRASAKNRLKQNLRELMWKYKSGRFDKAAVEARLCNYLAHMRKSSHSVSYYKRVLRTSKDKEIFYELIENSKIKLLRKTLSRQKKTERVE
jgi:retron-type reverse transcriptase